MCNIFIQQLKFHLHSYKRRWKCPLSSALQAPTVFLILLATFFRVSVVKFKTQSWIFLVLQVILEGTSKIILAFQVGLTSR